MLTPGGWEHLGLTPPATAGASVPAQPGLFDG
jgi:hypothetical protein